MAKKGRAWASAGNGGRRRIAAGTCGNYKAMTAFCLTTVSLASARLKGRSSPSSSRCRSLFRQPERRNCSFPTGLTRLKQSRQASPRARSHFIRRTLPTRSASDIPERPFSRARSRPPNETLPKNCFFVGRNIKMTIIFATD